MDKKLFKSIVLIVTYCIILVVGLVNINVIFGLINKIFSLLSPVIIGFCIAFILNNPYKYVYSFFKKLQDKITEKRKTKKKLPFDKKQPPEKKNKSKDTLIKFVSLLIIYLLFIFFISLLISMILPQLGDSITKVYNNISTYVSNFSGIIENIESFTHIEIPVLDTFTTWITDFVKSLPEKLPTIIPNIFDVTKTVASSLTNFLLGFVMSIYMLASKEMLIRQLKNVFYAFVPEKPAKKITHILEISNDIFGNFVNGRIYDALIIGLLCFIGMSIFGFEYTILITVLVAVTNVIPVFGPFLGAIPSIFLLLMVNPWQAFWFTVFILELQQLDGNVIGPKVVGDSIGLPAWWVMFSILIGGGIGDIFGMLAGVPVFAVIYKLISEAVEARKAKKEALAAEIDTSVSD